MASVSNHAILSSEQFANKFLSSKYAPSRRGRRSFPSCVKVVAEERDNLDYLQRGRKLQQPLPKGTTQVAPPGLWYRFPTARTVQQMMDTMERIMEDPFAYSSTWPSVSTGGNNGYSRGRTSWAIKEGEKDYKMRFDMPGMTKDDVKVWVEQQMLVLKAEKERPQKAQESDVKSDDGIGDEEWPILSYGKYNYRIALPENTDYEKIKAEVKDGVLYITIPKASTSGKVMEINVK